MILLREPSCARIRCFLGEQRSLPFSYPEVGASREGTPPGYPLNGELAFGQGDLPQAVGLFEEAPALCRGLGDDTGVAAVLAELGQVAREQENNARAVKLSEEGLALGRRLRDSRVAAIALGTLGRVQRRQGNPEKAIIRHEESLALFREIGHGWAALSPWPTWRSRRSGVGRWSARSPSVRRASRSTGSWATGRGWSWR